MCSLPPCLDRHGGAHTQMHTHTSLVTYGSCVQGNWLTERRCTLHILTQTHTWLDVFSCRKPQFNTACSWLLHESPKHFNLPPPQLTPHPPHPLKIQSWFDTQPDRTHTHTMLVHTYSFVQGEKDSVHVKTQVSFSDERRKVSGSWLSVLQGEDSLEKTLVLCFSERRVQGFSTPVSFCDSADSLL